MPYYYRNSPCFLQPMRPEKDVHYTVVIDKTNPDPIARCVYADDAVGMTPMVCSDPTTSTINMGTWGKKFPFNKIKPCAMQDGQIIGYLNPNDYTLYEDGTPVGSESSDSYVDVMVEIPKIYYKLETIDNLIYVHISDYQVDDGFVCWAHVYDGTECDNIYIAVYPSIVKNYNGVDTFFSSTGQAISNDNSINYKNYTDYMTGKPTSYRMLNFDQMTLIQCLFILATKSTSSNLTYALGVNSGELSPNGATDKLGMYVGSTTTASPMKFMGIENVYGNAWQRVDGVRIRTLPYIRQYQISRRDPYSDLEVTKDGLNYRPIEYMSTLNVYLKYNVYLTDPYGNNKYGFLPQSRGLKDSSNVLITATSSTYFCDTIDYATCYGLNWGGDYSKGDEGGIFCLRYETGAAAAGYANGYRFVHYPIGGNE